MLNNKLITYLLILSLTYLIQSSAYAEKVLGVGVHLQQATSEEIIRQLNYAQLLGIKGIRTDAGWRFVENEKGELSVPKLWDTLVNEAAKRGIQCLIVLPYGHPRYGQSGKPVNPTDIEAYTRYAEFIVRHFKGRVKLYEIWNEWDMNIGGSPPGRAEDYVKLIRTVYPRLKAQDPNTVILGGGASSESFNFLLSDNLIPLKQNKPSFFVKTLSLGLLNYIDGLSIHIYTYWKKAPLRTDTGALAVLDFVLEEIKYFKHGKNMPVHITEVGWTSTRKGNRIFSTVNEQSQFLTSFSEKALARPAVSSVYIYELIDGNSIIGDIEGNFGVIDAKGRNKPAFEAVKKLTTRLNF